MGYASQLNQFLSKAETENKPCMFYSSILGVSVAN